jgi:hypothetical protein
MCQVRRPKSPSQKTRPLNERGVITDAPLTAQLLRS